MQLPAFHTIRILSVVLPLFVATAFSCEKVEPFVLEPETELSLPDTVAIYVRPSDDPRLEPVDLGGEVTVTPYAELGYKHQSAAVYGDYVFFVADCRIGIRLFDMVRKTQIYTLSLKGGNKSIYHCNQSTFGTEKYDPDDFFPLLYISQRPRSEQRCFTEVFRIIPLFNADSTAMLAFRTELVQEIYFPPMSKENSLGNANCVIDPSGRWMYTYSRNNNADDDNYGQCKITRFSVPDIYQREVFLDDSDIKSSFMIDTKAINMQGGCIVNDRLYIGQGYPGAKDVFFNVVDLREERLVKRYDLMANGIDWEPEGCFYYDGSIMISHTDAVCRIEEKE